MAEQATLTTLAVGDHVRLKTRDANQHQSFTTRDPLVAPVREPVDGIILSIREVNTGRLVKLATGNLDQYVIELLIDRTFNVKYASLRNAPRGSDRPTTTQAWQRTRTTLRDFAEKGELFSTSSQDLFTDSPLAKLLDGWKVVKIWSRDIETLEKPEAPAAAGE